MVEGQVQVGREPAVGMPVQAHARHGGSNAPMQSIAEGFQPCALDLALLQQGPGLRVVQPAGHDQGIRGAVDGPDEQVVQEAVLRQRPLLR